MFESAIPEPRLVIFLSNDSTIDEIYLSVENEGLAVTSNTLSEGLACLMAAYYVYNVDYPKPCKPTFYFLQEIVMGKGDGINQRPVRYSTFLNKSGLYDIHV